MIAVRNCLLLATIAILFGSAEAEQSAQPIPALSIAHAAMRVSDLARSREFYRKLGFEEAFIFEKNGSPTEVFLKVNDRQFIELYPRENPSQTPGLMHVCFESSDIEGLNKIYRERGVSSTPVTRGGAGNLLFSVRYPEQQVIEFTEYMPGSMHSNDHGKHLGANRIARHITGVGMPVEDVAAAIGFYEHQLGFRQGPSLSSQYETLLLPGASGEIVKMRPGHAAAEFILYFSVSDLQQTASSLTKAHIPFEKHDSALTIVDPDGSRIILLKK